MALFRKLWKKRHLFIKTNMFARKHSRNFPRQLIIFLYKTFKNVALRLFESTFKRFSMHERSLRNPQDKHGNNSQQSESFLFSLNRFHAQISSKSDDEARKYEEIR
jgi:hypothetical protein